MFPFRRAALVVTLALVPLAGCDQDDDGESSSAQAEPVSLRDETSEGEQPADAFSRIPSVVRQVEPSVVAILTDGGEGSGVVWRKDGLVVTNEHVVAQAHAVEVGFADGTRSPARVLAADPLNDLALLQTERRDLPPATFARKLPAVGSLAIAIGNPLGLENTVTAGVISAVHRQITGPAILSPALVDLVQTDAAISPGNSGGALVDALGRVVGINVAYLPPEAHAVSIGFAIPSPTVEAVVEELATGGPIPHRFIGVVPAPLTPEVADELGVGVSRGVILLEVAAGSPAELAGLRPGDVVVAIDGRPVDSVGDLLAALKVRPPGDRLVLEVVRRGERQTFEVVLSERTKG